jgi:ATP-dependent RNA helicase DeaD
VATIVAERATVLLEARLRDRDKLQVERMQRFIPQVRRLSENEDGLALLAMLLDDFYQDALHAPAIPPEPAPRKDSGKRSGERKRNPRQRSGRRKPN